MPRRSRGRSSSWRVDSSASGAGRGVVLELHDRDDPVIDLQAEPGLSERLHVPDELLRRPPVLGDDMDLGRATSSPTIRALLIPGTRRRSSSSRVSFSSMAPEPLSVLPLRSASVPHTEIAIRAPTPVKAALAPSRLRTTRFIDRTGDCAVSSRRHMLFPVALESV